MYWLYKTYIRDRIRIISRSVPRKKKFSGLKIQREWNDSFQHCEKPLEIFREKLFYIPVLLSNLLSNFVENIFCMIHSKMESHNLIYITVANSGGKMRHIASFKNSYFHEILIWKTLKPVITLWLSPGKIEQHCLGLKLFICPAEVFWPNILQLCFRVRLAT